MSISHAEVRVRDRFGAAMDLLPGLALVGAVTAAGALVRQIPGLGVISLPFAALIIGIGVSATIGRRAIMKPGITFAMKRLLRLAIVLLGLQLTLADIGAIGFAGAGIIIACVVSTFVVTLGLARVIGVERGLAELIAAGTSICGASAVMAANTVTRTRDEDVGYAIACVTIFGSIAMVAYPLLIVPLGLSPHAYGLWTGASVHEVAQVAAAAFQAGPEAGQTGTITKLARVLMLAPVIIGLGLWTRRSRASASGSASVPVPWFVFGFLALVVLGSVVELPHAATGPLITATPILLAMALAAMGLEIDPTRLRAKGLRPLALGAAATLFISVLALGLVTLAG